MSAENNCLLFTFPRVAHTHNARIPRPVSYVRFFSPRGGRHARHACGDKPRNVAREGRKVGGCGAKKRSLPEIFVTDTPSVCYAHFRGEKIAEDCNPKSAVQYIVLEVKNLEGAIR